MPAPQFKEIKQCYGFDEVALVPGDTTINPEQVNTDFTLRNFTFPIPFLASAMDAVVDTRFAVLLSQFGGLAVLNLEGVNTRYDDADSVLTEIASVPDNEVTPFLRKVYSAPIKENLIGERISEIKRAGAICAVSRTPSDLPLSAQRQG